MQCSLWHALRPAKRESPCAFRSILYRHNFEGLVSPSQACSKRNAQRQLVALRQSALRLPTRLRVLDEPAAAFIKPTMSCQANVTMSCQANVTMSSPVVPDRSIRS
jgi:hypothetical protein